METTSDINIGEVAVFNVMAKSVWQNVLLWNGMDSAGNGRDSLLLTGLKFALVICDWSVLPSGVIHARPFSGHKMMTYSYRKSMKVCVWSLGNLGMNRYICEYEKALSWPSVGLGALSPVDQSVMSSRWSCVTRGTPGQSLKDVVLFKIRSMPFAACGIIPHLWLWCIRSECIGEREQVA